jgi:hypothetical protein
MGHLASVQNWVFFAVFSTLVFSAVYTNVYTTCIFMIVYTISGLLGSIYKTAWIFLEVYTYTAMSLLGNTIKPAHVVTSIKQSPVFKELFHVVSYIISYEWNLF